MSFTPGLFIQAELVFYPSKSPLRALVKRQITSNPATGFTKFRGWQQVAETETRLSAEIPVRSERPFIIQQLVPVQYNNQWWLQDTDKKMMQLKNAHTSIWKLLSLSGGEAMTMAVLGKEDKYEPVGVWYHNEYKAL